MDKAAVVPFGMVITEGSEYTIPSHSDFLKCDRMISVEHNFTAERERIQALLQANGYSRVFEGISQWDDWYVMA